MSEHLTDRLRRAHDLFRRDHDKLREQLLASLPEQGPEPTSMHWVRRGWQWMGASKMRRRVFGMTAVAASLVLVAFVWMPGSGGGSEAYGMNDVVNLLRTADVFHAKGYIFQPPVAPPGQERVKCPVEFWIDRPNGRSRLTRNSVRTDDAGMKVSIEERISDGQFVMDINHTEETVEYTRLTPFRRALDAHTSFDQQLEQWFGDLETVGFKNTGPAKLGDAHFDLWENTMGTTTGTIKVQLWVEPRSRQIAALKYWTRPPQGTEWTLGLDVPLLERNVPIPPGTFDTTPPEHYSLKNTKETATVGELHRGGGVSMDGVNTRQHIEFGLEDGSVLLGWHSWDEKDKTPQDRLFANLTFGGTLPKMPVEIYALKSRPPQANATLVGCHVTHTKKEGAFYEWSLYVPNRPAPIRNPMEGYDVLHRFHLRRRLPGTMILNVGTPIRIRNKNDFDALVLGAMAELSDSGKAPVGITYDRVMELTRRNSTKPSANSQPTNTR